MTVTSGFFNSIDSDRKYDARQISEIFDGIVQDGIYQSIGEWFKVYPGTVNNTVQVGTGRAWFNHVWVKNWPTRLEIALDPPDQVYYRYDAIVIEINHDRTGRIGSIKKIKGTASSNPQYPVLTRSPLGTDNGINQYPLAYIRRPPNNPKVDTSQITITVGTAPCPFVTGPLKVLSIEDFWAKWNAEWTEFLKNRGEQTDEFLEQQRIVFLNSITAMDEANHEWITKTHEAFVEFWKDSSFRVTDLITKNQMEFMEWFENLQVTLEGDVAANLVNKYLRIEKDLDTLAREQTLYRYIEDSEDDSVLDSDGQRIGSITVFELKHIF